MTTLLIKKACNNLGLSYQDIGHSGAFIKITLKNRKAHLCIANNLGLNTEVVEKICRDKVYSHELLSKHIRMPHSSAYVDSDPPELYQNFVKFHSHQEIVADILKKNPLPVVLKPNSKSMGVNVFLCTHAQEVKQAVAEIFNKNSYKYDHVLLVQEQIKIKKEFRIVVYKRSIQFAYQKDNTGQDVKFTGNLSPLHFSNAKAVLLDERKDAELLTSLHSFLQPIFEHTDLQYAGLDIVQEESGGLCLLELNSKPGFKYFIQDNGEDTVIQMFETILSDLLVYNPL